MPRDGVAFAGSTNRLACAVKQMVTGRWFNAANRPAISGANPLFQDDQGNISMKSIRQKAGLSRLILATAFGLTPLSAMADDPPQVVYPFVGVVQIAAPENAVSAIYVGLYGTLSVLADGSITGGGAVIYDAMAACAWEPPQPYGETAPYCNIEGVVDAGFSVSGLVVDTIHRHDDDNPLKDHIFALADAHSDARLDYAPLRVRLTLTLDGRLVEHLSFWGFSEPGAQPGQTHAATLGVLVSGLFDSEFEIAPIGMTPLPDSPDAVAIAAARQYFSEGAYHGGTPVTAAGSVGFIDTDPARLPTETNPWVYLQHTVAPIGERALTSDELAAMALFQAGEGPDAHNFDRDILTGGMRALVEGLDAAFEGAPPSPYQPIGLLDNTRAPTE